MRLSRGIPVDLHGAIETFAAPAIMAAPFLLGFGEAAGAIAFAFGVVLLGLALSLFGDRRAVPLHAHASLDYALAISVASAGAVIGLASQDASAAVFLVGIGVAQMALTAMTRFTAPRGA
jgi:hypothetical protein